MVRNSIYKCNYCNCLLRLRYQVGYFNIPVSIYCPKCNCHISGTIVIDNKNTTISENIIGATETNNKDYNYVLELATEFLIDKYKQRDETTDVQMSMFVRRGFTTPSKNQRMQNLLYFVNQSDIYINKIENIYNLLSTNRVDLIRKYFLNTNENILVELNKHNNANNIINELDAMLATKHYVNSLLQPIMPEGVFNNMYQIMNEKTRRIVKKHVLSVKDYLNNLDNDYFKTYLFKMPSYIIDYIKCVDQLLPVYDNFDKFGNIDFTKQGVSTISIDDLAVLYKKGFELLCDSIDLLVGLYNIETNGTYNHFDTGIYDFNERLNGMGSKYNKYEYFTNNNSDLFDGIRGVLNNIIRNAEGHNSIFTDGLNQEVTFINKTKNGTKTYKTSFLEFGKMCVDLFTAILYIWEYYYQFTKFKSVLIDGVKLHYGK